jgi:RND family efflux transporter MFP subunit
MPDHNLSRGEALPAEAAPTTLDAGQEAETGDPRRRRRRRWWPLGLAAVALAAAGVAVVAVRPDFAGGPAPARTVSVPAAPVAPAPLPPALTVAVAPAEARSMARPVVGDGSILPWQELVVGTEASGLRVAEVAVEEGERVREGQLLVRLDDSVLRAQRDQFAAGLEEAEAALRVARQDLDRTVELARGQIAARQQLDQRRAAADQADARLAVARAKLLEIEARLAQTRILAPDDGVVTRRTTLLGAVVQPGQEMARMIRDGRLELYARIPELELGRVRPGQAVKVTHGEREIAARVRALAPTVVADTRLGTVYVALPPDSGLLPGMFARAEIATGEAEVLAVPLEALVVRDGRPAVFVLPPGAERVALRPVATGARREGMVEVTRGLAAGERIVVAGAGFLADGDRVRVAEDAAAAPAAAMVSGR